MHCRFEDGDTTAMQSTRNPVSQAKHGGIANSYIWGKWFSFGVIQPHSLWKRDCSNLVQFKPLSRLLVSKHCALRHRNYQTYSGREGWGGREGGGGGCWVIKERKCPCLTVLVSSFRVCRNVVIHCVVVFSPCWNQWLKPTDFRCRQLVPEVSPTSTLNDSRSLLHLSRLSESVVTLIILYSVTDCEIACLFLQLRTQLSLFSITQESFSLS